MRAAYPFHPFVLAFIILLSDNGAYYVAPTQDISIRGIETWSFWIENYNRHLYTYKCIVMSVSIAACSHGRTGLPPDVLQCNLIFGDFSKICQENSSVIQTWQEQKVLYICVSQSLWDSGPVNSFFIRRGPGPNKFTRKYLSNFC